MWVGALAGSGPELRGEESWLCVSRLPAHTDRRPLGGCQNREGVKPAAQALTSQGGGKQMQRADEQEEPHMPIRGSYPLT